MLGALTIFAAGSAVSGSAASMDVLIVGRGMWPLDTRFTAILMGLQLFRASEAEAFNLCQVL